MLFFMLFIYSFSLYILFYISLMCIYCLYSLFFNTLSLSLSLSLSTCRKCFLPILFFIVLSL